MLVGARLQEPEEKQALKSNHNVAPRVQTHRIVWPPLCPPSPDPQHQELPGEITFLLPDSHSPKLPFLLSPLGKNPTVVPFPQLHCLATRNTQIRSLPPPHSPASQVPRGTSSPELCDVPLSPQLHCAATVLPAFTQSAVRGISRLDPPPPHPQSPACLVRWGIPTCFEICRAY